MAVFSSDIPIWTHSTNAGEKLYSLELEGVFWRIRFCFEIPFETNDFCYQGVLKIMVMVIILIVIMVLEW